MESPTHFSLVSGAHCRRRSSPRDRPLEGAGCRDHHPTEITTPTHIRHVPPRRSPLLLITLLLILGSPSGTVIAQDVTTDSGTSSSTTQPWSPPPFLSARPGLSPYPATDTPSDAPSSRPSAVPSDQPSVVPSETPSDVPSTLPSDQPSSFPSNAPSDVPSAAPSDQPSDVPSSTPSDFPSDVPSSSPSDQPSHLPSDAPSDTPSVVPSAWPSSPPSESPTTLPSVAPSASLQPTPEATIWNILGARQNEWSFFYHALASNQLPFGEYIVEWLDTRNQGADYLTVFVPSNLGWASIPHADAIMAQLMTPSFDWHFRDLITYHMVWGAYTTASANNTLVPTLSLHREDVMLQTRSQNHASLQVNGLATGESNIFASNGIIHVLDSGILAPSWMFHSVGDHIRTLRDYSIFYLWMVIADVPLTNLDAAIMSKPKSSAIGGLPETNPGEITLLVPSNESVERSLSVTTLDYFSTPGNEPSTAALVAHHVMRGIHISWDFVDTQSYETLLPGSSIQVTRGEQIHQDWIFNGNVRLGQAMPASAEALLDLLANNGVVHSIDGVLIPTTLELS